MTSTKSQINMTCQYLRFHVDLCCFESSRFFLQKWAVPFSSQIPLWHYTEIEKKNWLVNSRESWCGWSNRQTARQANVCISFHRLFTPIQVIKNASLMKITHQKQSITGASLGLKKLSASVRNDSHLWLLYPTSLLCLYTFKVVTCFLTA